MKTFQNKQQLSPKQRSKKFRHEAYLRAKEYRKTDPRQIAMKEKLKEQRREAYQQAKERNKAYRDELKKAKKERSTKKKTAKQNKLKVMLVPASSIKGQETGNKSRIAKVTMQHVELVKAKKATVADIARLTGVSKQAVSQMLKKYAEEKKAKEPKESTLFGE
jgi:Bacterial regulatory proteins, lacI family